MLAGGCTTGMIGDPRDTGERTMNNADTVAQWSEARIRGRLERFVDFDDSATSAVENNLSWTRALSAIEFLRDVGKHFSVNVMLDRDTIQRRRTAGASPPEFGYMLLRVTDYVGCTSATAARCRSADPDQWGNIIAGVRLVRRQLGEGPRPDGAAGHRRRRNQFGKSTGGGGLWLDQR